MKTINTINIKQIIIKIIALLALSSQTYAGMIIDVSGGGGMWFVAPSGDFKYNSADNTKITDALGSSSNAQPYIYADINHFIPFVPNVNLNYQALSFGKTADLANVKFGDKTFSANTKTNLDLPQIDILLYWNVPLIKTLTAGVANIEWGIDYKLFSGSMSLKNNINEKKVGLDFGLPMLYLGGGVDIPFAPIELNAKLKGISYKSSSIFDIDAKISYTALSIALIDLKIDGGYKLQSYKLSKDLTNSISTDFSFGGPFVGISAKF